MKQHKRPGPRHDAKVVAKPTRAAAESLTDTWRRLADERLRLARKLRREHRWLGPRANARTREPVFSCRECVFRMDSGHWRNISDEETAVLRALKNGGPATIGDILSRARRKVAPLYRLLQALATLVAQGYIEEFKVRGASGTQHGRPRPRHSRVRLPSWAKLLLPDGSRLGLGPASEAGRASARLHPKSRRPPA
jgi:hypothetical protein